MTQPLKLPLYEYQKEGVVFLEQSGGRAIVADQPGVGKTAQALAYIARNDLERSLVVCPASVKSSWKKEIEKWTNLSYEIIDSKTKVSEISYQKRIWIINYDILKKFLPDLQKIRFSLLVCDEAHKIKSISAQRTKATKLLSRNIPKVILLSGTPLLSRPIELYPLLNIIDERTWYNYYDYGRKYCAGHQGRWGYDVSGVSNSAELHEKIKKYFIRRKKLDVLKELPPKNRIDVPVEMEKEDRGEYDFVEDNFVQYLKLYQGKQPAEIAKSVQAEKLVQLGILRRLIAKSALKTAEDLIEAVLESGEKILVFSSFHEPLQKLKEEYGDEAVIITGNVDVKLRGEIVSKFQNDPSVKIFLGGYQSAGEGITLTAASNVLKLDYPWTCAESEQSEDRAHRPGAEYESLTIYQLHVQDTIATKLKKILEKKQKIINEVIDGEIPDTKQRSMVDELIDDIAERRSVKWAPMDLSTG